MICLHLFVVPSHAEIPYDWENILSCIYNSSKKKKVLTLYYCDSAKYKAVI